MTRVLGLVCARGGSKGIPGKNIKLLAGKPLLGWTLDEARKAGVFADIACSSDDAAILHTAAQFGANILIDRPANLATDEAGTLPVITHALAQAEKQTGAAYDYVVLLQPTSPFRQAADITGALALARTSRAGSVLSATRAKDSPYSTMYEQQPDGTFVLVKTADRPVLRRQDAPLCYALNGAIYVWDAVRFKADPRPVYSDTRFYEMPEERSLDIDTPWDFMLADLLMRHLKVDEKGGE